MSKPRIIMTSASGKTGVVVAELLKAGYPAGFHLERFESVGIGRP